MCFVKHVTDVPAIVSNLLVGFRLQNFLKVVQILRGLHPPLLDPAELGKVINHYKLQCQYSNLYLLEASLQLISKNAVELIKNQTSLGEMADFTAKRTGTFGLSGLSNPAIQGLNMSVNSQRETNPPWQTTHVTHTVASQKQLESTRISRKGHTHTKVAPPSLKMAAVRRQCASMSTITATKTCSADVYRCIKRRMGRSLK